MKALKNKNLRIKKAAKEMNTIVNSMTSSSATADQREKMTMEINCIISSTKKLNTYINELKTINPRKLLDQLRELALALQGDDSDGDSADEKLKDSEESEADIF